MLARHQQNPDDLDETNRCHPVSHNHAVDASSLIAAAVSPVSQCLPESCHADGIADCLPLAAENELLRQSVHYHN
jgi:hypothetical protein